MHADLQFNKCGLCALFLGPAKRFIHCEISQEADIRVVRWGFSARNSAVMITLIGKPGLSPPPLTLLVMYRCLLSLDL